VLLLYPVLLALRPGLRRRLLLYAAALVLQLLAYPDPDLGFLGWVLLWPYLLARGIDDGAPWFRSAFLFGFFRAFTGFYWLGNVHYTAWLAVSLASGLAFALAFEGPLRWFRFAPYALRVAASWLLFEWVHSVLIGGFPWMFLSHTQWRFHALLQAADLAGAFGVSFLVAYVQAAALEANVLRRVTPSVGIAALLLVAALLYGATRGGPGGPEGPGVLMVQTAIPSYVKEQETRRPRGTLEQALVRLTREGLMSHPDTDLVVWPETMFPVPYVEDEPRRTGFPGYARSFARLFQRPLLVGLTSYASVERARRDRGYNAALLVDREGRVAADAEGNAVLYRKQRLVPMSEEFLARRVLPGSWCDRLFAWLSENFGLPPSCDLESGEGFATLDAGPGLRCAMLICFEGLYPDLARGAVAHGEPDLILHLVNNGWFLTPPFLGWRIPSFEQRQCLASWVFRAVETRTPLLSCANAGITCAVGPDGRLLGQVDRVLEEGVLHVRVPPRWPAPPCLRGGFLLPPALLLLALPVLLWGALINPLTGGFAGFRYRF
jgi:apolipoprotein N-acyltransferase